MVRHALSRLIYLNHGAWKPHIGLDWNNIACRRALLDMKCFMYLEEIL